MALLSFLLGAPLPPCFYRLLVFIPRLLLHFCHLLEFFSDFMKIEFISNDKGRRVGPNFTVKLILKVFPELEINPLSITL